MNKKGLLIFLHEFVYKIKSTGFIILTFIVPVIALIGIGIFNLAKMAFEEPEGVVTTIGYVDETGDFDDHNDMGITKFIPFASREAADQALTSREIAEYFVIPEDFIATGSLQRYTLEKEASTPPFITDLIWRFLSVNLLDENTPPETIALILTPLNIEVTWVTEEEEIALEAANPANIIIPGIFALLLSLSLMFGVTSLINGLGEEKESRLIEVLLSSVSIPQLLVSKVLALGLAGLLQVVLWLVSAPLLLNLASSSLGDLLQGIEIPANFILLGAVYFVLGYLLFAVLSIGVGAISSNATEGNALAMIYTMTGFIPLWFLGFLIPFPNSPIWVVLTLFPTTAPIQTMIRLGISEVPLWQIIASIIILVLSIVIGLYLVIKIFRTYMLMYGKRPGLREIYRQIKAS
jgi:ABC-2 type transport system permease protein